MHVLAGTTNYNIMIEPWTLLSLPVLVQLLRKDLQINGWWMDD